MATIKRLCALQTCRRSLWVSPPCPPQEGAQPKGLWQEEGKEPPAPAEPLAASLLPSFSSPSTLCIPSLILSIPSASLSPYTSPWLPPRTRPFAGHCNAKVGYRGQGGPCLVSTILKVTMISEMQKCQGVQDQEGRWERGVLSLSWGKGQDVTSEGAE